MLATCFLQFHVVVHGPEHWEHTLSFLRHSRCCRNLPDPCQRCSVSIYANPAFSFRGQKLTSIMTCSENSSTWYELISTIVDSYHNIHNHAMMRIAGQKVVVAWSPGAFTLSTSRISKMRSVSLYCGFLPKWTTCSILLDDLCFGWNCGWRSVHLGSLVGPGRSVHQWGTQRLKKIHTTHVTVVTQSSKSNLINLIHVIPANPRDKVHLVRTY